MKYSVTLNGKIYEVEVEETQAVITSVTDAPVGAAAPVAAPAPVAALKWRQGTLAWAPHILTQPALR